MHVPCPVASNRRSVLVASNTHCKRAESGDNGEMEPAEGSASKTLQGTTKTLYSCGFVKEHCACRQWFVTTVVLVVVSLCP